MSKKTTNRLPRPLGLTSMLVEYNMNPTEEKKKSIQAYIIHQWSINSGIVFNRSFSSAELASFIGCSHAELQVQLKEKFLSSKLWDTGKMEEVVEAMMGQALQWAIDDKMQAEGQVKRLMKSQGDRYMPFVSGEVNKAISLNQGATNNFFAMAKQMMGGGTTNIFNQINNNNVVEDRGVTVEQAVVMISDERAKLENTKPELMIMETQYDILELPEVVATKQTGVDTSKEGLTLNAKELQQITDNYPAAMKESEETHHEMRRLIQENIDDDAEDPELFPV